VDVEKLEWDSDMVKDADEWAAELGSLNNSITAGDGNFAGRLGELALAKHLNVPRVQDDYWYDLIYKGETIEVKTKRRTWDPMMFYDVSVAKTSTHQQPDRYAFISITGKWGIDGRKVKNIWLCGFMDRDEFFKKARFMRRGKTDKSNGFKTHADMYNLEIGELHDH
jgi:hypothetical protein